MTLSQDYVYQQKSISSPDQNDFVHFAMQYPVIQAVQGIPLQGALQPVTAISQQQQNINLAASASEPPPGLNRDLNYIVNSSETFETLQPVIASQQQQNINNPVRESATSAQRCVLPASFPVG